MYRLARETGEAKIVLLIIAYGVLMMLSISPVLLYKVTCPGVLASPEKADLMRLEVVAKLF